MNLTEAQADAQARADRTGLYWFVIKMKGAGHEAVQAEHLVTHKPKYQSGIFKVIGERYEKKYV